jgi:YidC/Oxa1 family membrane protein insertase
MDQQKRFLLAMALCGLIVLAWQYLFPPPVPDQVAGADTEVTQTANNESGTPATKPAAGDTTQNQDSQAKPAQPAKVIEAKVSEIKTDKFAVTLTNEGGAIAGINLLDPEQYQAAGNLLGPYPKGKTPDYPFTITFGKGAITLPDHLVYEVAAETSKSVTYRHVDPQGRYVLERSYTASDAHPYVLDVKISVTNSSTTASLIDNLKMKITGFKDPEQESSFLEMRADEIETICHSDEDTERELFSAFDDGEKQNLAGPVTWGAVNTRYFFWGIIPEKTAEDCVMTRSGDYISTTLTWDDFSVPPSSTYVYNGVIYTGPKDLDVLNEIGSELNETVDYGIFTILAKPMRWLLNLFFSWVHNWGLAIILLTFVIKIVTWPFTEKSYANAERMKEIQPQLDELRKTHENDQQRLAEETMKLFKENKFNPLGGCFPMLLQMPILYGLFVMINNSVELYQANFILWYTDLSASDPYFVLPILMGIMMLIQQHFMTPASSGKGPNQQAQAMMKFMPIMFTAFMLFLPSGLVLYYSLNLVLGIMQQWLIRRKFAKRREARGNVVA